MRFDNALVKKAAEELNIDLKASYMIGDSDSDVQAGEVAGCTSIKINEGGLLDAVKGVLHDYN